MTLELKLILYGIAALALVGGLGGAGYQLASHHYERIMALQKAAADEAQHVADQKVIAAQTAQHKAEEAASEATLARQTADAVSRDAVLSSVRNLETAVHNRLLPAAVVNPSAVQAAQPGGIDPQRLAGLVDRFNASLDAFIGACQHADEDRSAIVSLEPVNH